MVKIIITKIFEQNLFNFMEINVFLKNFVRNYMIANLVLQKLKLTSVKVD